MRYLKIDSLPKATEWVDKDEIMLHACFQLLQDCIDKEHVDTHCCYEAHKEWVDEARALYKWWQERKVNDFFDDGKKDDEMLSRLIKIRMGLWT